MMHIRGFVPPSKVFSCGWHARARLARSAFTERHGGKILSRPPALPATRKTDIILMHLRGELTISAASKVAGVSEQSIGNWKRKFISAGKEALESTAHEGVAHVTDRERQLRKEIHNLKAALGDAFLQLRAIKGATRRDMATRPWNP
ncbi:helix-turn-helix domain-containing protein [Streptomyces sp. DW26H14]|uniref:helix-turn-helix domain-containing protein n=1 Tax=Streptomyces sp. DW26H14 TaxID=3435395 RepID=UPI00403D5FF7